MRRGGVIVFTPDPAYKLLFSANIWPINPLPRGGGGVGGGGGLQQNKSGCERNVYVLYRIFRWKNISWV